jgi:hypothetical protein
LKSQLAPQPVVNYNEDKKGVRECSTSAVLCGAIKSGYTCGHKLAVTDSPVC